MDITPPNSAMSPFHRHTVKAVCKGASHTYRDTLQVALLWGQTPGPGGSPMQSATGDQVTVIVRKSDWRAEFNPAPGAVFVSTDHGTLDVRHVQSVGDAWHCVCIRNLRAKAS
jgi:hypothetical protein